MIARRSSGFSGTASVRSGRNTASAVRRAGPALGLIVWAGVAAYWAEIPGRHGLSADPVRLAVVGGFLVLGPGLALTRLLRLPDRLLSWTVAMGTSLAVLVLGAQAALYVGRWSPAGVVRGTAAGTVLLALVILARQWRHHRTRGGRESGDG